MSNTTTPYTVIDYTVSFDYDVHMNIQWGKREFELIVPAKITEEWVRFASKLTATFVGGSIWSYFESYMITDFNDNNAMELVNYVIKNHSNLIKL